jgi:hypothetical protein
MNELITETTMPGDIEVREILYKYKDDADGNVLGGLIAILKDEDEAAAVDNGVMSGDPAWVTWDERILFFWRAYFPGVWDDMYVPNRGMDFVLVHEEDGDPQDAAGSR